MYRSLLFRISICSFFGLVGILGEPAELTAQNNPQEIQFVETYALSTDREKTLEQLVPGTEAYYYYHCLHFLTTEQTRQSRRDAPAVDQTVWNYPASKIDSQPPGDSQIR